MNPKHILCVENVNWVNLAENRINWPRMSTYFSTSGVHTRCCCEGERVLAVQK
jgi:hypothetical protein